MFTIGVTLYVSLFLLRGEEEWWVSVDVNYLHVERLGKRGDILECIRVRLHLYILF